MIVVSDTTAITTLLKAGCVDLLEKLFVQVLMPPAVERELREHHAEVPPFCQSRPVAESERLRRLRIQADAGEAEAICLAVETHAEVLLIDDKKGRRLAEAEGVRCLGLPAVLLEARRQGFIDSLADALDLLERRGNFCLSARSRSALLQQAGE